MKNQIPELKISVFKSTWETIPEVKISFELDISDMVDWYAYHDAPSSVSFTWTIEKAKLLQARLEKVILEAEKLVEK